MITQTNTREYKGKSLLSLPNDYVIIDIETTGLDPKYDHIIEISAIKVMNNKMTNKFTSLIKNERIPEFITELTGISTEMTKDAPPLKNVLNDFYTFINDSILLGHNVNFDINFLYDKLKEINLTLKNDFVDTLRLSRIINKELKHHRMTDLLKYYNINNSNQHRALNDCEYTHTIYNNIKNKIINDYGNIELLLSESKQVKSWRASDIVATNNDYNEDNYFYGKEVVFTGALEKMTRKEAMQIIVNLGGNNRDTVTNNTNYLILGNNDYNPILRGKKSSKLIKAEKLKLDGKDIEILSENVFYDILKENNII